MYPRRMPLSYRFTTAILTVFESFGVVHHIPEIEVVLAEINRVLETGEHGAACRLPFVFYPHPIVVSPGYFELQYFSNWRARRARDYRHGANGVDTKPYVRLYSKSGFAGLVSRNGFRVSRCGVYQVNFEPGSKLGFFCSFESWLGWYVALIASK